MIDVTPDATPTMKTSKASLVETGHRRIGHKMDSTVRSPTLRSTELLFYFWLPAERDEFELPGRDHSPFQNVAKYRSGGIEETISRRLIKRLMEKTGDGSLKRFSLDGDPSLQGTDLGLQKVGFKFRYKHNGQTLNFAPDELTGSACILSNGLYIWQFDFKYPSDLGDQEITELAKKFLCEDFVEGHIAQLFEFGWNEQSDSLDSYRGILTYHQIDHLFNTLFDKDAHPRNFMNTPLTSGSVFYNVRGIIQSASLFKIKGYCVPLFGELEGTLLENGPGNTSQLPSFTKGELYETMRDIRIVERLLSFISYVGMAQFLKVAISFSIIHYKAGLDHCRAQLTDDALLIRIHKTSGELRRPSLSTSALSAADLQSYTSIVAGKLPGFLFIHSLIKALALVSHPSEAQNNNILGDPGWEGWAYSRSALDYSLLRYHLHIESIKEDITEINRSLEAGRSDQVIAELTDFRKLAEIASESPKKIVLDRNDSEVNALMVRFTLVALIFSFVQAYASIGVWLMDILLKGDSVDLGPDRWLQISIGVGQWIMVILVLVVIYRRLKGRPVGDIARNNPDESSNDETYVFDYSFLHEELNGGSAKMIDKLTRSMPSINPAGGFSACARQSSFRETPLSAVERTKYTLESQKSPHGSYIFHAEFDRRMNIGDEYLREVRLVIKKPIGKGSPAPVAECVQHIVLACVASFHFKDRENAVKLLGEQLRFLNKRSSASHRWGW